MTTVQNWLCGWIFIFCSVKSRQILDFFNFLNILPEKNFESISQPFLIRYERNLSFFELIVYWSNSDESRKTTKKITCKNL
ncbi:hypothetical protein BpHYR1_031809 [Brachionus plicatilis]|uniref:Uncharacterized protein n=1 Tax=Brachionus plicatilis TaxID=10195 RepID=A0A3M7TAT7_BRAPC|nr:hypothetical protein BpHYR1_031809 [Brachionus plicatilis]